MKCEGLPLAIIAIGGLLAGKDSSNLDEWEIVHQRLGDEFEGDGKFNQLKRILSLSYNDLSFTLKSCLLYTSIYPEDHLIKCKTSINLWIAERLVEPKERQTAEEVGWKYLKELANRSLIQFNAVRYCDFYIDFRIHDVLREVLVSKSRELNMVTVLSDTQTSQPAGRMIRRLVFHTMNIAQMTISREGQHALRTVRSIVNCGATGSPSKTLLTKLLTNKLLTIVDLRGIELDEFPTEVFELFQLKLLYISGKKIETIPKSIKRLQNLEVLSAKDINVKELPMEIQHLRKLRHLLLWQRTNNLPDVSIPCDGIRAPCGLGDLSELQSLELIDVSENKKSRVLNEIGKLTKLRELYISNLSTEVGNELCCSLEKLNNLEFLGVTSSHERRGINILDLNHPISPSSLQSLFQIRLYGLLETIPPWLRTLQKLERITLSLSNLKEDPLETLQHLPNLFEIVLIKAYQGESICFKSGCFVKLKTLFLKRMKGLRRVIVEKDAMPGLKKLVLSQLPLLEELAFSIDKLSQLQELDFWAMSTKLINKLLNAIDSEEESRESENHSHVPQVTIHFWNETYRKWESQRLSGRMKSKEYQHEILK